MVLFVETGDPPGCGNNRCERGEECTDFSCSEGCPDDCPHFVGTCPYAVTSKGVNETCSGHGYCHTGAVACVCSVGYTGPLCGTCTKGYVKLSPLGPCIFLPGVLASCADGVKNGNEIDVDCGGPNCAACPALPITSKPFPIIAVAAGVAGTVVAAILLLLWYLRSKLRKNTVVSLQKKPPKIAPTLSPVYAVKRRVKGGSVVPSPSQRSALTPTRILVAMRSDKPERFQPVNPVIEWDVKPSPKRAFV